MGEVKIRIDEIDIVKGLAFFGAYSLDILLLHFGIGEIICMILGFWYPIYDISEYPKEAYAWRHPLIVVFLTVFCIGFYFAVKQSSKNNNSTIIKTR